MIDLLPILSRHFTLTPCDTGKYAAFKAGPLKVSTRRYEAAGLGSVSVLEGSAMLGLMKLVTVVINPWQRDIPLFSFDEIGVMKNGTWLVEYYNTVAPGVRLDMSALQAVKDSLAAVGEYPMGQHWYDDIRYSCSIAKKDKASQRPAVAQALNKALAAYAAMAAAAPALSGDAVMEKQRRTAAYVDGLLSNGGPSTDAFVKAIGKAETEDLFTGVVFYTAVTDQMVNG